MTLPPDDEAVTNLRDTPDAPALRPVLVTRAGVREVAPSVAVELFERHHAACQPGAAQTALLLCTDWRWRRTSATVLAGVLAARWAATRTLVRHLAPTQA